MFNNQNSLFAANSNNSNDQDTIMEAKFQNRQDAFLNEENFTDLKETEMKKEYRLGQNVREKIFIQKRIKMSINSEQNQSLKSKLTISKELYENCEKMSVDLYKFNDIIQAFRTQDINQKYTGLVGIRKLLSLQNSPIQELIDQGIVPELISLLDNSPAEFQYEALWCLTNIATGTSDQANNIVVKGGIPKIIKLLDSSIEELKIQSTWLLGNLSSDCLKIRDTLIKEKAFDKLVTIIFSTTNPQLIKQGTWAMSNFFRIRPKPPFDAVRNCLNVVARAMNIMSKNKDNEFLADACFILYFMTEFYKETIKDLFDLNLIPQILSNLEVDNKFILINCLRIVGNIASGNANQTQKLLDFGALNYLKKTIFSQHKQIRKETAWILSNIAAGTQKQIETLIAEDILPILDRVIKSDEPEIKKECIWAVCNLTSVENIQYIEKILKQGILRIICDCLRLDDAKYLAVCLEAFGNLLAFGKKSVQGTNSPNPIVEEVDKMGMFDVLEKLQLHPVEIVYEKTLKILENYFETQNVE
jgi:hypothetical protein